MKLVHLISYKLRFKLQSLNKSLIKDFKCFGEVGENYRVFCEGKGECFRGWRGGRRARLGFRHRSNVQVTINNDFAGFGGERRRGLWRSGGAESQAEQGHLW